MVPLFMINEFSVCEKNCLVVRRDIKDVNFKKLTPTLSENCTAGGLTEKYSTISTICATA